MASRSWIRNQFTSATHIRTGKRFAFSRFNDAGYAACGPVCAVSKWASLETLCRPTSLVGPAGLTGSKGIKHLSLSGTVGIPDASACLSQPVVSAPDNKKSKFEPLEHSVYFGRQRLGHYVRVGKRLYAAYGASGRLLGRFKSRKKAWAAISGAADEGGVSKRRRRSASVRPTSRIKNAVRKRNGILASGRGGEQ